MVSKNQLEELLKLCSQHQDAVSLQPFGFPVDQRVALPISVKHPFFEPIDTLMKKNGVDREYLLEMEDALNHHSQTLKQLNQNRNFCFFIAQDLSSDFIKKMIHLQKFSQQIKLIVVARKDWRFREALRLLSIMVETEQLWLDFPRSLYSGDFFYSKGEKQKELSYLKTLFPQLNTEYCPDLSFIIENIDPDKFSWKENQGKAYAATPISGLSIKKHSLSQKMFHRLKRHFVSGFYYLRGLYQSCYYQYEKKIFRSAKNSNSFQESF